MLYGWMPPLMVSPHGSQVLRVSVTFAVTVKSESGELVMTQSVVVPAVGAYG